MQQVLDWLGGAKFDLIISDIAPNTSGIDSADAAKSIYLLELALDMVRKTLKVRREFRRQDVSGVGVGSVFEGTADTLRESADPQARRVAQRVARGLYGGQGFQGMRRLGCERQDSGPLSGRNHKIL